MSAQENKAIIRRWLEAWNQQNVAAVDELVASDFVRHDPNAPEVRGQKAEKELMSMFFTAFPDLHGTIEDLIAEGDRVVGRFIFRGTHKGELLGVAPTGKQVTVSSMEIYRLADGKIAEQWAVADILGMLQQLGVVPSPGQ